MSDLERQIFQMHDTTDGREFLGQSEFVNTQDFFEWGSKLASLHPNRRLEMVSSESPDFMEDKTSEPAPTPVVAGIMVCERCGKTCRCPYCNKF